MIEKFVSEFERNVPSTIAGQPRQGSVVTNRDRVFIHYDWAGDPAGPVAFVRIQLRPREASVWISHLEVHPHHRGRGIGTGIVKAVERTARGQGVRTIRLFPRYHAIGFWRRLGFLPDPSSRNLLKALADKSLAG